LRFCSLFSKNPPLGFWFEKRYTVVVERIGNLVSKNTPVEEVIRHRAEVELA